MSAADLEAHLVALDGQALQLTHDLQDVAIPVLSNALAVENAEVRELAAMCLAVLPAAREQLVGLLADPAPFVRIAVLDGMAAAPQLEDRPVLLAHLDHGGSTERGKVALLIGRIPGAPIDEARERRTRESESFVSDGWLFALCRLGDLDARRELAHRLERDRGERGPFLSDDVGYLLEGERPEWLAPMLVAFLSDSSVGSYLGHGLDPEYLHVRDLAVQRLAPLLRLSPGFDPIEDRHFQVTEIARVRMLAEAELRLMLGS